MGSLIPCCWCCDDDDDDEGQEESQHDSEPARMARGTRVPDGIYRIAPQASEDEEDEDGTGGIYHSEGKDGIIHEFFRRLRQKWQKHDSVVSRSDEIDPEHPLDGAALSASSVHSVSSPLRTADSFDSSSEILTINPEEIVMPGSELQKAMAKAASLHLEEQDDECVICMEGFDPTNPRMPTLCGCGQNKTYFHLPCLYQWIEQSRECPSCRQKLRWQEF